MPFKTKKAILQKGKRRVRGRQDHGSFMIEFLVAVLMSSFIAVVLFQGASQSLNFATVSKNDALAEEMLDELAEQTIAYGYSGLSDYADETWSLQLNKITVADVGPLLRTRPMLLDMASKKWSDQTQSSSKLSDGTVTYQLTSIPDKNAISVNMLVSWKDNSATHLKSRSMLVYDDGLGLP